MIGINMIEMKIIKAATIIKEIGVKVEIMTDMDLEARNMIEKSIV